MNNKILTVTIPAYNAEKYLQRCADSILLPELLDSIEVLIVNDGSEDGTEQLALGYYERFPQTVRVISKENGGHGSAVNVGIHNASGKYFKVVDADDWVDSEAFADFVNRLARLDSDIVATRFLWVDDNTGATREELAFSPFENVVFDIEQTFLSACDKPYIKMHSMTIKTGILRENDIRLDEKCFYVDAEYVLFPVPYINTVTYFDMYVYMYRVGTLHQSMNIGSMQKNIVHHERVLMHLIEFYGRYKENSHGEAAVKRLDYLAKGIARFHVSQIKIYLSFRASAEWKRKIMNIEKQLKEQYPEIYSGVVNRSVKLLRRTNYMLYRLASALLRRKK